MRLRLPPLLALGLVACAGGGDSVVPSRVDTTTFDGRYEVVAAASFKGMRQQIEAETDPDRKDAGLRLLARLMAQFEGLTIEHGVIRSGHPLVQEFSLTGGALEGTTWRGKAVWHEDIHDPGDAQTIGLQLALRGEVLEFAMLGEDGSPDDPVVLRRLKE